MLCFAKYRLMINNAMNQKSDQLKKMRVDKIEILFRFFFFFSFKTPRVQKTPTSKRSCKMKNHSF